jgi:hypothetical protein
MRPTDENPEREHKLSQTKWGPLTKHQMGTTTPLKTRWRQIDPRFPSLFQPEIFILKMVSTDSPFLRDQMKIPTGSS